MKSHLLSIEPLESRIAPASIVVTSTADNGPHTLRAAIDQANGQSGVTTIVFKLAPHSTILLSSALPTLFGSVSILGPGASKLAIDGGGKQIFLLENTGSAAANSTLSGLTLKNAVGEEGGAIEIGGNGSGTNLTIKNCVITGNTAIKGAGIFASGLGGPCKVVVQGTTLSGNVAVGDNSVAYGGGIYNNKASLLVSQCTITGNSATGSAGKAGGKGADTIPSPPSVAQPGQTGLGGYLAEGGGIFNTGSLTIQNSVISGNQAFGGTGGAGGTGGTGLSGASPSYEAGGAGGVGGGGGVSTGGGIFNGSYLTVIHSKITGNSATGGAGGTGGQGGIGYTGATPNQGGNGGNGGTAGNSGGGGIAGAYGVAFIQKSTITGNSAAGGSGGAGGQPSTGGSTGAGGANGLGYGGGIFQGSGSLLIQKTAIGALAGALKTPSGNTSDDGGGVAILGSGTAAIQNSSFLGNKANARGGGIAIVAGSLTITSSTVSGLHGVANSANQAPVGGGIYNSGTLSASGLTLSLNQAGSGGGLGNRGTATLDHLLATGNNASTYGGALYNTGGGVMTVTNSTLGGSSKPLGNSAGDGGGIFNTSTAVSMTVSSSTISGNTAVDSGGGIDTNSTMTVKSCIVSGNTGQLLGGGIFSDASGPGLQVQETTISGNSSPYGGGILNFGVLTVSSSTVSGNTAGKRGGGIESFSDAQMTLIDSTIANNIAQTDVGGGVAIVATLADTTTIENCTISGNTSGVAGGGIGVLFGPSTGTAVTAISTIVAGNKAGAPLVSNDVSGSISLSADLIQSVAGMTPVINGAPSIFSVNPLLGPLGHHGGPTETMLPGLKSPAIDHGLNPQPLLYDQRGDSRLLGFGIDIGAVEVG